MSPTDWRVLAHRPLEKVADNLWRAEGDIPGMPLQRVMVVVRTKDGRLVIHGAIALEETAMKKLEALGEPAVMLVPSGYHRLDAARLAHRYPKMRVYCPPGGRARVAARVRLDGTYDDFDGDATIRIEPIDGIGDTEGVIRVASQDGTTLVFNDILFNMPHPAGFGGVVTRMMGSSGGPRVTRTARFFLLKDARALARRFVALAKTPELVRVMVAHHETITERPADVLRDVALTL
jgi:hypothetical protein